MGWAAVTAGAVVAGAVVAAGAAGLGASVGLAAGAAVGAAGGALPVHPASMSVAASTAGRATPQILVRGDLFKRFLSAR